MKLNDPTKHSRFNFKNAMSYGAGKAWVFSGGKYVNLTIWQLVISLVYEWLSPRKRVPTVKHLATAIEEAQPGAPKNRKKRIRADASPTSQSLRGVVQFAPHRLESVTSHDRSTFQLCMYLQNDMSLLNIAWTNFLIPSKQKSCRDLSPGSDILLAWLGLQMSEKAYDTGTISSKSRTRKKRNFLRGAYPLNVAVIAALLTFRSHCYYNVRPIHIDFD